MNHLYRQRGAAVIRFSFEIGNGYEEKVYLNQVSVCCGDQPIALMEYVGSTVHTKLHGAELFSPDSRDVFVALKECLDLIVAHSVTYIELKNFGISIVSRETLEGR